ncbi:MAG: ATP-binding protein [Deltaproteobacteria bacterium]|nr:ATP-binding protein [Deltaproteobacteria bacterium]
MPENDLATNAEEARRMGLRWLAGLRWWAISGAMIGVVVSMALSWTFVSTPEVVSGLLVMVVVNGVLLWRTRRELHVGRNELLLHATVDLGLLCWLLAWAGGVRNPLSLAFSFHVVLGALLNGRRGVFFSSITSLVFLAFLWILEQQGALPTPPLVDGPPLLWALALGLLVVGLGYLALEVAERQRNEREKAQQGREEVQGALDLLLDVLAALKVGVDVKDAEGRTVVQNDAGLTGTGESQALLLEAAKGRAQGRLDADDSVNDGRVTERFTVINGGVERLVELIALRPKHTRVSRAFLTVDRTEGLLVEQRHIMLERLATLGRAMQGVAHELNTPLTTMQTLAKDLQAALKDVELKDVVRADVDESLSLLVEETRRCRSLTQSLLSTANDGARSRGSKLSLVDVAKKSVRLVGAERDAVFVDEASLSPHGLVDADRVLQILMNLIQNALAATADLRDDGKGPRVVVDASFVDGLTEVRVQDRGPGLPAPVRERLFEPFVTTKTEGTGLGLYTSQQLAREIGGSLAVGDAVDGPGTRAILGLKRLG